MCSTVIPKMTTDPHEPWPRIICLVNDEAFIPPEHGRKRARGPSVDIIFDFCTVIPTQPEMAWRVGKATSVGPPVHETVLSSAGKAEGQLSGTGHAP